MKTFYGLKSKINIKKDSVVCMGIFDGVHIGHKKILSNTTAMAKRKNIYSAAITFSPNPAKVLKKSVFKSNIISLKHRIALIAQAGIDLCFIVNFTEKFAKKKPDWFIEKILSEKIRAKTLVVGEYFKISKTSIKDTTLLNLLDKNKINLKLIKTVKYGKEPVSSSLIRALIKKGDIGTASKLLGRAFTVYGTVKAGRKIGREIGFPTANVDPHHEVLPPPGVYNVKVKIKNNLFYKGVLNIGFRPTFALKDKQPSVEVHIIGFNRNLYNKDIEIYFINKIRDEKKFKNREALRKQIKQDIISVMQ